MSASREDAAAAKHGNAADDVYVTKEVDAAKIVAATAGNESTQRSKSLPASPDPTEAKQVIDEPYNDVKTKVLEAVAKADAVDNNNNNNSNVKEESTQRTKSAPQDETDTIASPDKDVETNDASAAAKV